ncbi:MAG: hypothetical protein QE269_03875 [Fimbriimonas sp.]|nr:hypothetical protein [Fimbriimonas sp.]
MTNYLNIGLPHNEWVIVKHPTGRLEDLGYVRLQEQMATTEGKQVAPIGMNRVLVQRNGEVLLAYLWGEREQGLEGGFSGRVKTGDRVLYIGKAAYELAKSARKLIDF